MNSISTLRPEFPGAYRPSVSRMSDDFWPVFRDLVEVRESFDLARPVLSTLRALITFMERGTIVFASNHKICERAEGISQSTLRRHIKSLIDAGFARRIDSPNGKRFTSRAEGLDDLIFGIDLSPLLAFADTISARCAEFRASQARLRHLRKSLGSLLWQAETQGANPEDLVPFRKALRRKLALADFEELHETVENLLKSLVFTEEMTGTDSQNDCHNNITNILNRKIHSTPQSPVAQDENELLRKAETLAPDALAMLSEEPFGSVEAQLQKLGSWTGISEAQILRGRATVGPELTLLCLLLLVQNVQQIRNPPAYFAALTSGSRSRQFAAAMLKPSQPESDLRRLN